MTSDDNGGKKRSLRDLIRFILFALAVGAVIKELRKPEDQRTWHGAVFDVVPYDFRKPSAEKFKAAMWNPEGSLITPRVFGVGWTVNAGAAVAKLKKATQSTAAQA